MSPASVTAETIFGKAISISEAAERSAYLNQACAGDPSLRSEVERLVRDHFRAGDFMQRPGIAIETAPPPPAADRIGSLVGPYKLLEQIGEGGMGVVYVAEQTEPVRRRVAVKIVKPGMDSGQVIARFEAERQALAMMDHPNIAKVLDAGATDLGRPFFVMELVRGMPITEYCDKARLAPHQRLDLFISVCRAVQHAHQKGIIHRDLKPSNVMVTLHDGTPVVKVIDFGVAKAVGQQLTERTIYTAHAQLVGTPLYMSPEQAELSGLDVDTRSDVYSLGVLLYELLTGHTPFDRDTLTKAGFDEMRRIIREDEPPRPSHRVSTLNAKTISTVSQRRGLDERQLRRLLRGELDWIVMKSLEKDRSRRYESASSLAADIQRYLNDEPVQACPPSAIYRLRKFARRHKATAAAAVAGMAFVILVVAFGIMQSALAKSELQARRAAEDEAAQKRVALSEATNANDTLRANQAELRRNLYRADTDLAYQAWSAGLADRAVELLDRHRPQAGQADIRGFEWFHLWQRSHDYLWNFRDEKHSISSIAFSHSKSQIAVITNARRGDRMATAWIRSMRWRKGKPIDQFGKPIENYHRETAPKRPPPEGDTIVRTFDGRRGTLEKTLSVPSMSIGDPVFSHDDSMIVFRTFEGLVAIDIATGDTIAKRSQPTDDGNAGIRPPPLAASPIVSSVVTALDDENVTLLDVSTMQVIRSWPAKRITQLRFSPDGKLVAGAGHDAQIFLWEADTGALKQTVRSPKENPDNGMLSSDLIAFSPSGSELAFPERKPQRIVFWDISTGARTSQEVKVETNSPYGNFIETVQFIPGSNLIAAGCLDGLLRFWDTKTGSLLRQTPGLRGTVVSNDGKLLAAYAGKELRIFERELPSYRQVITKKREPITCVCLPGTDTLISRQNTSPLQRWRISTGQAVETFRSVGDVGAYDPHRIGAAFAVSMDGHLLAVAEDETFSLYSGDKFADRRTFDAKVQSFECIAISPDKRFIATGGSRRMELGHSGNITIWDAKTLKPVFHMHQPWPRLPNDTTRWAVDVNEGFPEVTDVAFSPDGKQLATTSGNKEVCVWNVQTGELQHELWILNVRTSPCLAFSSDGTLLASVHDSASERYTIKLCNPHSGEVVASLIGHTNTITRIAFSPDGKTLASAGDDGIRLWNVATRERTGYLDDARATFTSLSFSGDGKTLIAGDAIGQLHFWRSAETQ